jgi:hypothetical protein
MPIFPVIFARLCPSYPPFTDSLSMSSVISWRDVCRVYVVVIYIYLYVYRSQHARASHDRIANKRRSPVAFNIACSARRDSASHERRVEFSGGSILSRGEYIISRRVFQNLSFDRLDRAAWIASMNRKFTAAEDERSSSFLRGWRSLLPSRSYAESRSREDSPTHFLNQSIESLVHYPVQPVCSRMLRQAELRRC